MPICDYIDNPAVVTYLRQECDDYETSMVRTYHEFGIDLCRGYGSSFEPSQEGIYTGEIFHTPTSLEGRLSKKGGYQEE